jgi:ribosomal protein S14
MIKVRYPFLGRHDFLSVAGGGLPPSKPGRETSDYLVETRIYLPNKLFPLQRQYPCPGSRSAHQYSSCDRDAAHRPIFQHLSNFALYSRVCIRELHVRISLHAYPTVSYSNCSSERCNCEVMSSDSDSALIQRAKILQLNEKILLQSEESPLFFTLCSVFYRRLARASLLGYVNCFQRDTGTTSSVILFSNSKTDCFPVCDH